MNRIPLSYPEIGIIAGTRAAFGAGVGLLVADRLSNEQRRAVGWTLLAIGAITTVPILFGLIKGQHEDQDQLRRPAGSREVWQERPHSPRPSRGPPSKMMGSLHGERLGPSSQRNSPEGNWMPMRG